MVPQWIIPRSRRTMLGMTLIAILLAVGHHLFYRDLMGKEPPDSKHPVWGSSIHLTGQQINLSVGTLLAFLVKAFLGLAVSTAHEQHVWGVIKTYPTEVASIDGLFSAKSSVFSMFTPNLWRKSLISMLLALIFWLLPIASFIAPASLTVHQMAILDTQTQRVPKIDFTSMNFANAQSMQGQSPWHFYDSPQFDVQRVVTASATASQILPISPPSANSSWLLGFNAPALSCQTVSDSLVEEVRTNILDAMVAEGCTHSYGYLSWVPASQRSNASLPFEYDSVKRSYNLRSAMLGPNNTNAYRAYDPDFTLVPETLSLFVAALPNIIDNIGTPSCDTEEKGDRGRAIAQVDGLTVAQCFLYNASYVVNFDYVDGVQSITPVVNGSYNDVSGPVDVAGAVPFLAQFPNGTYVPLTADGTPTSFNTTLVETYSFAAVMESFGSVLVGSISSTPMGLDTTCDMASTELLKTRQLGFFNTFYLDTSYSLENLEPYQWNGLSISKPVNFTTDWLETVEKMFQNATISLMESNLLRPNYSSPYAPPDTLVTVMSYRNTYVYSVWILWASYGTAIGVTIVAVSLGILSAIRNGASYTTKFSTVLRVAPTLSLSSPMREQDLKGEDPAPETISRIIVAFPNWKPDSVPISYEAEGMTPTGAGLLTNTWGEQEFGVKE
ncbi:hypothetical protein GGR51DRAFT_512826 [Nemania sp. FL0031]|nr:hypothetical protein GGR51DRAFT_512826 [Nemania sp. FL0031]